MRRVWLLAGVLAGIVVIAWLVPTGGAAALDLRVYRGAVDLLLSGQSLYDFTMPDPSGGAPNPFLYPPFAAVVMLAFQWVPLGSLITAWQLIQMAMAAGLVWLLIRRSGWKATGEGPFRFAVPALLATLTLLSAPVMLGLNLGQVSLLMVVLVMVDLLVLPPKWRGVLIGLAGAIKLTPLFFIPYLLITRQWRAAANATAAFAGATLLGFALLPADSIRFWTSAVFESSRIPNIDSPRNLSILGQLKSFGTPDAWQRPIWLMLALVVTAFALWRAWSHHRRGEDVQAALVVGIASVLVSPVAWSHHLVWMVLAGAWMVLTGARRTRKAGWVLLGFCSLVSPFWLYAMHPPTWYRVLGFAPVALAVWICVAGLPHATDELSVQPEPETLEVA